MSKRGTMGAKILFLGKEGDIYSNRAVNFVRDNCDTVESHLGRWNDPLPESVKNWEGEYIISFLSRWVVPGWLLERAKIAAINFHPASPEYPGIGCNNFALYKGAEHYGTTCHHMTPRVDEGKIIATKRFNVYPGDSVATILKRTYDFQLVLFYEMMDLILTWKPLPLSNEEWSRKAYSRKEFNELATISPEMDKEEMDKRIRATSFGAWLPTIEINGHTFELKQ